MIHKWNFHKLNTRVQIIDFMNIKNLNINDKKLLNIAPKKHPADVAT